MTKNKIFKIIISILIFVTLFMALTQTSLCMVGDISNKFSGKADKSNATNTVGTIMGKAINVIQVAGAGIAILMLVVLGIKWVSGAPEKKAKIKEDSTIYIIGAVFIFVAVALLQIIKMFTGGSIGSI